MEDLDQRVEQDDIIYLLNEKDKTARIIGFTSKKGKINIPLLISHKHKVYPIISISKCSFKYSTIKSITFSLFSRLQTIEEEAFSFSLIESIEIPSQVSELKGGWCMYTPRLNHFTISLFNSNFQACSKMIVGKRSNELTSFDCLFFCVRDAESIVLPNFIEHISPYAFYQCVKLRQIEIPNDSKLQTIGKFAFSQSSIENFTILSQITQIDEGAFSSCDKLKNIEIPDDSQLQTIDDLLLSNSEIESISIPSSITKIGERAFYYCSKLKRIDISNDSKL